MRRTSILPALIAVALAFSALAAGCGGESGQAREYIRQGDEIIAAIEKQGRELGTTMEDVFSDLYEDISSGKAPDLGAYEAARAEMESLADDMIRRAGKARSAFEQVDTLEDVPKYKEYADLKIQIVDSNIKGLEELKRFLDEAGAKLSAADFDVIAFQSFVTQYGESVKQLGEEGGKLQKQAEALRKSEDL